jgi:hypothetical protein
VQGEKCKKGEDNGREKKECRGKSVRRGEIMGWGTEGGGGTR